MKNIKTTLHSFLTENNISEITKLNENFHKWFGTSKVVDNDGNPLVVYHGSKSKFDIFKVSGNIGKDGEEQMDGIYFTDSKEGASFFALAEDDRFLKQAFLKIENPYVVNNRNELKDKLNITDLKDVNILLKEMGHDGLIVKNDFYANGGPHTLYLAFDANQAKSIYNDGSWDINDDNIYS